MTCDADHVTILRQWRDGDALDDYGRLVEPDDGQHDEIDVEPADDEHPQECFYDPQGGLRTLAILARRCQANKGQELSRLVAFAVEENQTILNVLAVTRTNPVLRIGDEIAAYLEGQGGWTSAGREKVRGSYKTHCSISRRLEIQADSSVTSEDHLPNSDFVMLLSSSQPSSPPTSYETPSSQPSSRKRTRSPEDDDGSSSPLR